MLHVHSFTHPPTPLPILSFFIFHDNGVTLDGKAYYSWVGQPEVRSTITILRVRVSGRVFLFIITRPPTHLQDNVKILYIPVLSR